MFQLFCLIIWTQLLVLFLTDVLLYFCKVHLSMWSKGESVSYPIPQTPKSLSYLLTSTSALSWFIPKSHGQQITLTRRELSIWRGGSGVRRGGVMCVKHPPWVCPKNGRRGKKEKGEREREGRGREGGGRWDMNRSHIILSFRPICADTHPL